MPALSRQEWALKRCPLPAVPKAGLVLSVLQGHYHSNLMIQMKVSGLQKVCWTSWWLGDQELDVSCKQFVLQPLILQEVHAVNERDTQSCT